MNDNKTNIALIDNYKDYNPPSFIHDSIDRLLSGIPQKYLIGIKSIILTNSKALTSDDRKSDNKKMKNGWMTLAFYSPAKKAKPSNISFSKPAHISMYIDRILEKFPNYFLKLHFMQDVIIGAILYHEIGHHIHYSKIPEYQEREIVAKKWKKHLINRYLWKQYWYCMISIYPLMKIAYYVLRKFIKKETNNKASGNQASPVARA